MGVVLPPDLETLRRLVRGQLSREDRIRVDRWLGRCVDPRLPRVLDGLVTEWREEARDGLLSGLVREISELWITLFRAGKADIDAIEFLPDPAMVLSSTGSPSAEGLVLMHEQGVTPTVRLRVAVRAPAGRVVVASSNDLGEVHVLLDQQLSGSGPWSLDPQQSYQLEGREGRVTFWLLIAVGPLVSGAFEPTANSLIFLLETLRQAPPSRVYSARLSGPEVLAD